MKKKIVQSRGISYTLFVLFYSVTYWFNPLLKDMIVFSDLLLQHKSIYRFRFKNVFKVQIVEGKQGTMVFLRGEMIEFHDRNIY